MFVGNARQERTVVCRSLSASHTVDDHQPNLGEDEHSQLGSQESGGDDSDYAEPKRVRWV